MKLIKSPLILDDFFIINSNYKFIEPVSQNEDLKVLFNDYEIDIDFIVRSVPKEENKFVILSKVSINQNENPISGYSLFAESVCFYSFDTSSGLNENEKSDMLWHSGVSMSVNSLRNFISSMTSFCPLGKYTLPSIDLTSLLNEKKKILSKKKKNETKEIKKNNK